MVTRMVRHYDQEERESDAAVHWDTIGPKLIKVFGKHGAQNFSERYWIQLIQEGNSEKRVDYCVDHQKNLGLPSSNSRTLWWYSDNAGTDGIHVHSIQLERVHLSQRMFVERAIYLGEWTDSRWKRKRQSTESSLLYTSESFLVIIQMKKNTMMTTHFLRKCVDTVIGNVIRMPFVG